MVYLTDIASSVRNEGIVSAALLAKEFGSDWVENFIKAVAQMYDADKKGYNYRITCLKSLSAVMPYTTKEDMTRYIIPVLVKGCKDDIPNVQFCVSKIIADRRSFIDPNVYTNQLYQLLKDMS